MSEYRVDVELKPRDWFHESIGHSARVVLSGSGAVIDRCCHRHRTHNAAEKCGRELLRDILRREAEHAE